MSAHIVSALSLNTKTGNAGNLVSGSCSCLLMLDKTSYHFIGLNLRFCPTNHVKYVAFTKQENLIRTVLRLRGDLKARQCI